MANEIITRDLGSVVGPTGPQGPQGDSYVLTDEDKTEIAQQVGELDFLPAAVITVNCISDYSELPIYATVKLLNADGELMEQSEYAAAQKKFLVTPFTDYILRFEAAGYEDVEDYEITSIPKAGVTVTKRFVPSEEVTFTVDYKVDGVTVQHNVVDPHGSVSYTGDPVSASGKVWIGWDSDDESGTVPDVTENMVINATFVTPVQPAEIKDMSLYDYIYSEVAGDNAAYSRAEFAWILLNGEAKNYWSIGNKINIKMTAAWDYGDVNLIIVLEAFKHFRLADGSDLADTTWLTLGVPNALSRRMNATNTNIGGWAASEAGEYIDTTVLPKLPQFLRSLIKKVKVLSSAGGMSAEIVSRDNFLWFPSQAEVFNSSVLPYRDEVDSEAETLNFTRLTTNTLRKKATFNNEGTAQIWWLRSPNPSGSSQFRDVAGSGGESSNNATNADYWALGFCI